MEDHEIREENAVLRQRVKTVEQKMDQLVQALEKRNDQIKEWAKIYSDLQQQFYQAQESANTQASFIQERNNTIQQLTQLIDELRQQNYIQTKNNLQEAEELRENILKEKQHLVDTLNHMLEAKIPAEEAFREMGEVLEKKNQQVEDLKNKFEDLSKKYAKLNDDIENRDEEIRQLDRENRELGEDIKILKLQLADARSGRCFIAKIDQLSIEVERLNQIIHKYEREKSKLKKVGRKLKDDVTQRNSIIEQLQDNLKGVMDQNVDLRSRLSDQQQKNYNLQQKMSKSFENEKNAINKFQQKKNKAHMLKLQIKDLEERIAKNSQKKSKIAISRLRQHQEDENEALRKKELKIQLRKEIEKRLDAEQEVFNMKDEMESLKTEIAKVKREYAELKGADVQPLIELLRDLQVEAITINSDYYEMINSIPEEHPIQDLDIPEDFCESPTATKLIAQATQYFIENKELRVLVQKFARHATIYGRISRVLGQYPILSTEDIGTQAERGSWILPADIEHLQRCVIKLHELLIRKKIC